MYNSLDYGKITLFTELTKNSIPPVLPSLGYIFYLLIEVGSAVPFPKLSVYCFYQTETKNFFKGRDSHAPILTALLLKDSAKQGNTLKIDRL